MKLIHYIKTLIVLFVMAVPAIRSMAQTNEQFTVITFNIRSFEPDFDVKPYAELLRAYNADFICLNEVENRSSRQMVDGKYRDVVQDLANELGMFAIFGYSYNLSNKDGKLPEANYTYSQNEMYGNAILSRYPVMASTAQQLPRPNVAGSDQRGVLSADFILPSMKQVRIIATHLDHRAGQLEQASFIVSDKVMVDNTPAILMGDMNMYPGSSTIQKLEIRFERLDGDNGTFQSGAKLDYIMGTKGSWKLISTEVLPRMYNGKELSDHFPLKSVVELIK